MKFQMLSTVESRGKDKLEWREKEDYAGEYLWNSSIALILCTYGKIMSGFSRKEQIILLEAGLEEKEEESFKKFKFWADIQDFTN